MLYTQGHTDFALALAKLLGSDLCPSSSTTVANSLYRSASCRARTRTPTRGRHLFHSSIAYRSAQGTGRWLLLSLDRLQGNQLVMTQELIANMLGVRREGVTEGALKLQRAGLISYARGHITVLDRAGLEKRSCECYSVVKKEYGRLLPNILVR